MTTLTTCLLALASLISISQDDEPQPEKNGPRPFPWMAAIADEAPVAVGFVRHGSLLVFNADSGEVEKALEDPVPEAQLWRLDVDPSGELVALLTRDNRVWLWNWREEAAPSEVATLPGALSGWDKHRFGAALEWGPKGETLLVGHGSGGVLLLDREGETRAGFGPKPPTNEQPDATPGEWRTIYAAGFDLPRAWSASGDVIALVTAGGPTLFDSRTGEEIASGFDVPPGAIDSLALDAEASLLVTGHYGGIVALHHVESKTKRWTYTYADPDWGGHDPQWNPVGVGALAFSPSGEHLAATVKTSIHALILDPTTGDSLWHGPFCGGRMGEPATIVWAPDGRSFFHAYVSGVMALQHVRLMKEKRHGFAGQLERERGTLPDIGWEGVAIYATLEAIHAVDAVTWEARWSYSVSAD